MTAPQGTAASAVTPTTAAATPGAALGLNARARTIADQNYLEIKTHVLVGHPVRIVVELAREIAADLLVIGATGHSGLYERLIGSRADRIIQLAPCPVLVVK